ncbi:acid-sensing ion channel 3-like [Haliotis rubra]|uniref:acid-sensing ion channel 3-like n=1 Tax=Haliotis rubra TaxID=36100 RepID=UPI001EE5EA64|nr:acid-sensing ion channel 3-like [Haliotis rubra]
MAAFDSRAEVVLPPREKKWDAVKGAVHEYMSNSTVHGFSKAVGQQLYFGRRLLWMLIILGAALGLASQIYTEVETYNARPTLIQEQFFDVVDVVKEVPTISLCPLKALEVSVNHADSNTPLTKEEMTLQRLAYPASYISESFLSTLHIKLFGWVEDDSSSSALLHSSSPADPSLQVFADRSWEKEAGLPQVFNDSDSGELLKRLAISSKNLNLTTCPRKRGSLYDLPCCNNLFTEVLTETGLCHTLNMTAVATEGKQVGFFSDNRFTVVVGVKVFNDLTLFEDVRGLQVVVHNTGDPVLPTKRGVFVSVRTQSRLTIQTTKRINLPPPFRSANGYCLDTDVESPILTRFPDYQYSVYACERECLINYTVHVCGCRHAWDPGQEDMCSIIDTVNCIWPAAAEYGDNPSLQTCHCPTPCRTSTHEVTIYPAALGKFQPTRFRPGDQGVDGETCRDTQVLSGSNYEVLLLDVGFPVKIREVRQLEAKTLGDILAALGGLIGLFLGFSIVSVVEIAELLFLILRGITCRMRKQEIQVEDK